MSVGLIEVLPIGTSNDARLMHRLAENLGQGDLRVSPSPLAVDQPFHFESGAAAGAVVILWTRDAASSEWLIKEIEEARAMAPVIVGISDALEVPAFMAEMPTVEITRWAADGDRSALYPLADMVKKVVSERESSETPPESESEVSTGRSRPWPGTHPRVRKRTFHHPAPISA